MKVPLNSSTIEFWKVITTRLLSLFYNVRGAAFQIQSLAKVVLLAFLIDGFESGLYCEILVLLI